MSTFAVSPPAENAPTSSRSRTTLITVDGPTTVTVDGTAVPLSPGERVVVAALVLHRDRGLTLDGLSEMRWPDGQAPKAARQSLHNSISRIRRKTGLNLTLDHGRYRLPSTATTDIDWLDEMTIRVGDGLAGSSELGGTQVGRPSWFADLPDLPEVLGERSRLHRAFDEALGQQVRILQQAGKITDALVLATRRRISAPQLDDPWVQEVELLLALGRRLDAAALYRKACRSIADLRGESPGPALRGLEAWIWETTRSQAETATQPLVGRTEDINLIRRRLTSGATVLLVGTSGSGKSRIVQALARDWPGPTMTMACGQSRMTALASIRDAVAQAGSTDSSPEEMDRTSGPSRLEDLVQRLTLRLRDTSLLVLDDVDRLAPLSREVLVDALRQVDCRVLATSRTASCGVPGRSEVALSELSPLAVQELARLAKVPASDVRILMTLVGHSPDPVIGLADICRTTRVTPGALAHLSTTERVPSPIVTAIGKGLGRHSRGVIALVEQVALGVVREPTAVDQHTLDEAVAADGPLRHDAHGHLVFTHPLLRRLVLDRLPPGLREEALLLTALRSTDAPAVRAAPRSTPLAA
ncbi:AAA family ATPase [Euzebya tangerina]|uniref:AAA family ATPase n=1 Tax=Euzebya tangerina TaxID=591198 RepID=UPI000E3164B8|nr:AAA family ATPase [Euzebya tangerina]